MILNLPKIWMGKLSLSKSAHITKIIDRSFNTSGKKKLETVADQKNK